MSRHCPDCPAQLVATWRRGNLDQVAIEHHRSCRRGIQRLPIREWLGTPRPAPVDTPTVPTRRERVGRPTTAARTRRDPAPPRRRR